MLFKLIGSIMILGGSAFIGHILSRNLHRRPQELRELQMMLQVFENEIRYLSSVLSDAFERVYSSSNSHVGMLFKHTVQLLGNSDGLNASEAWEQSVSSLINMTSLNREDRAVLLNFGKMLGNSDREGQLKNIRLTLEQLKLQEKKAEESRDRNGPMYKRLGVLAGAAIVIILI